MGYHRLMGYGVKIPAHQVGGQEKLWDIRVYRLSKVWGMRVLTEVIIWPCRAQHVPGP